MNAFEKQTNVSTGYEFEKDKKFIRIENYLEKGRKFDKEDFENIKKLFEIKRDLLFGEMHNFFSLYGEQSMQQINLCIKKEKNEERKTMFYAFQSLLEKYGPNICRNIECFIEEYRR